MVPLTKSLQAFHDKNYPQYEILSPRLLAHLLPGFRLVKCHCVVQALPRDDGHILGSRRPLNVFNPSGHGA
jgi:hypothetical protein